MAAAEENKTPNEKQKKQQESSMLSNAKLLLAQMRPKRMIVLSNLRLFMYASRWLDNLKVLKQQGKLNSIFERVQKNKNAFRSRDS